MSTADKHVVILGGGYFGTEVAKGLDNANGIKVTLVEKREVKNLKMGGARAAVAGGVWADRTLAPYSKLLKNKKNKIVHKSIQSVTDKVVTLEDGSTLAFDYLVIATGAQNLSPGEVPANANSVSAMKAHYESTSAKIKAAKKITIVGTGAVGIELAGEISDIYGKSKKITMVTSETKLFSKNKPALSEKFKTQVLKRLEERDITVMFGERVIEPNIFESENGIFDKINSVKLAGGKEIPSDLCIIASGVSTSRNAELYPKEWIDSSNGLINVQESTFAVYGTKNVFAIGDCNNIPETKFGGLAAMEAPVLIANLKSLANGGKAKKSYKANTMAFTILPMGESKGISLLPFGIVGDYLTALIKSKGLFSGKGFKDVNQTAPKVQKNWKASLVATTA